MDYVSDAKKNSFEICGYLGIVGGKKFSGVITSNIIFIWTVRFLGDKHFQSAYRFGYHSWNECRRMCIEQEFGLLLL